MAMEGFSRQHIGHDRRRLSPPHIRQLILLEIGIDPEPVRRDDAQKVGAVGNVSADLRGPAEYKKGLVKELSKRAILRALERAGK